jgi:methionyl-tRNA formyltransferase
MTGAGGPPSKKIGLAGCKHTTRDVLHALARIGFKPHHLITIPPELGEEQEVAGYEDLRPFAESMAVPYTLATSYGLKDDEDRRRLLSLDLDVLLVIGWQRLIPEWWLESLTIGAFGMHGSFKPLPHGLGRSPLNWSLLQGRKLFFTHLFQYLPGVDDGPVVGMQMFDLTPFDTCHTAHLKNQVAMVRLCERWLPFLLDGTAQLIPQPAEDEPRNWPKRSAEDGAIYWQDTTGEIYNLVRAVTKPFSGAFTFLDDDPRSKMTVWRAIPFDDHLVYDHAKPGEIVEVFYDGSFVVKTGDTSLLVIDSEGPPLTADDVGRVVGHLDKPRKVWNELPR